MIPVTKGSFYRPPPLKLRHEMKLLEGALLLYPFRGATPADWGYIPGGKGSQRTIARVARESARDSILSCSSRSAPATSTWPGDDDTEH